MAEIENQTTDDIEQDDDFAALFEASLQTKRFKNGQAIEGTIVAIGPEVAFVNVGGKGEATIQVAELKDDEGVLQFKAGDRLQATVMLTPDGLTLSRKLQRGAATSQQLEDAFRAANYNPDEVKLMKDGFKARLEELEKAILLKEPRIIVLRVPTDPDTGKPTAETAAAVAELHRQLGVTESDTVVHVAHYSAGPDQLASLNPGYFPQQS